MGSGWGIQTFVSFGKLGVMSPSANKDRGCVRIEDRAPKVGSIFLPFPASLSQLLLTAACHRVGPFLNDEDVRGSQLNIDIDGWKKKKSMGCLLMMT